MDEAFAFQVAGVRVGVVAPREVVAPLLGRWRGLRSSGTAQLTIVYALEPERGAWTLRRDGEALDHGPAQDVVALLELDVYRELAHATAATCLHAATVARDGQALLLVGPSGAGKSSLALALVARGWDYLGDEHAFVDDDLAVSALARTVRVGDEPGEGALPARVGSGPLPITHVVLLELDRTIGAPATPVSAAEASVALLGQLHRRPRADDVRRLTALGARVPLLRLGREGVDEAADAVCSFQSSSERTSPSRSS